METQKKILVIDDEPDLCDLVKIVLEKQKKFKVVVSTEAVKGIELAKAEMPDLILLDIIMPDMDGADVCRILSENEATRHIPVIFLSAIAGNGDITNAPGRIGRREFIAKPVTPEELIKRIEVVLEEEQE
ncbi:MAG: response regulator [Candidatus Omnitrophica bacterium]|nr:response regulator [Candidatus Omnitrophota bacterium]